MKGVQRRSVLLASGAGLIATGATTAQAAKAEAATAQAAAGDGRGGHAPDPAAVLDWNRALLRIVRTAGAQPATVHPTRSFAMLHAAVHDAVVSVLGGQPYRFAFPAPHGTSAVAAAAYAGHDLLAALYPAHLPELDAVLSARLATVPSATGREGGARVGNLAARALLALRADDGSDATPPTLAPGTAPGAYRPAPPAFAPAVFTHWPAVRPFVLHRAGQFTVRRYPQLASAEYASATNEVASLGQDSSTTRTADQTVQARFWAAPIWNYLNEIAQTVVLASGADLPTAARTFALLDLALADGVIAFYAAKYHFLIWRPVTAIQLAGTDGNPATVADPGWNPLASTPADPSYPGAHSVISQAGTQLLRESLGDYPVTVTSELLPGVTRSFQRLQDVADEAGRSRLPAGVHTRLDHESGQQLGASVAHFARRHAFNGR
ncbi:MAG: vanadium-dependent haloperoxidase [Micromonosporaceae bacterium]|nr:vanadium-dependent haloperoxidase [Micromonosporaceae bacterium]